MHLDCGRQTLSSTTTFCSTSNDPARFLRIALWLGEQGGGLLKTPDPQEGYSADPQLVYGAALRRRRNGRKRQGRGKRNAREHLSILHHVPKTGPSNSQR